MFDYESVSDHRITTLVSLFSNGPHNDVHEPQLKRFRKIVMAGISCQRETAAPVLQGLADLMSRSFWTRIWIVQEFILPAHIEMQCGTRGVSPSKLLLGAFVSRAFQEGRARVGDYSITTLQQLPAFYIRALPFPKWSLGQTIF
jgi:hypothetical protein